MGCCSSADDTKRANHNPATEYTIGNKIKVRGPDGIEFSEAGTAYSALNTEEQSEICRLSRAESVSKMTNEPSNIMMTLRRKFIITRAMLQHGINEDVSQFTNEIQDSITDMREKDRRRVREWLDSVHRALRGRKPTEFPPVNPKKTRGANGRSISSKRGSDASSSHGVSTSSKPGTKTPQSTNSPQSAGLDHLSPSAQIEAEFTDGHDGSGGHQNSNPNLSRNGQDTISRNSSNVSNDQDSTKAAITATPLTQESPQYKHQNGDNSPNKLNPHQIAASDSDLKEDSTGADDNNNSGFDRQQHPNAVMSPQNRSDSSDTQSPLMGNRVGSVASSVQAMADGDRGDATHKRPTAHSLGHDQ